MSLTSNQQFTQIVAADGSTAGFLPQWQGQIMSVGVQNLANVDAVVANNAGQGFTVSAGNNRTVNLPSDGIRIRAATTGGVGFFGVTIYADEQQAMDTGGSVLANIINSTITAVIQGTVNAIVSGTVAVSAINSTINAIVSGTVNAVITNSTIATTISGTVNTLIQNAVLTMTDVVVENNTTALAGVLANTVVNLSLAPNVAVNQTIARAIQGFALVLDLPDGFLDVWYTAAGKDIYLTRRYPFAALTLNTWQPLEKVYDADMPVNSVIHVLMAQTTTTTTGTLKY